MRSMKGGARGFAVSQAETTVDGLFSLVVLTVFTVCGRGEVRWYFVVEFLEINDLFVLSCSDRQVFFAEA